MATRFSRSQRLLKPAEFQRVFRHRDAWSSDNLLTVLAARQDLQHPRLGLAIAKKNLRRAVDRNRVKRQSREAFRHASDDLPSIDVVIMAKPDACQASNQQLQDSLNKHWRRLNKRLPS